ncbi:MAG: exodeoxyribonuclease VII small subunit, partial [Bacteroidetes bacterium]
MAKKKRPAFSYEQALAELQDIVKQLEEGTTSMDELTDRLARAEELIRLCQAHLRQVEVQVN